MTQQEMLDAQWSESDSGSFFGFTNSDWFNDVKNVAGLWGFIENGGNLQTAPQDQYDLMYSIERDQQPNAQYIDPRYVAQNTQAQGMTNQTALMIGGVGLAAVLLIAVMK